MRKQFLQSSFERSFLPALDVLSNLQEEISFYHPVSALSPEPFYKRMFDIFLASLLIVAAAPLMAVLAILVKLDSAGPVLYSQGRVGLNRRKNRRSAMSRSNEVFAGKMDRRRQEHSHGRVFRVLKFRSMHVNAEAKGAQWCQRNDPRITRIGRILRKTHLDELPQLFNVLMGDMSIVGPRPERPEFVTDLKGTVPNYERRLDLKPGLTGLAQIRHRSDEELTDVKKKVRYDLFYMKRASLWTDTKIVLGTVPLVFGMSSDQLRKSYEEPTEDGKSDKN
jgi:lipopolysaccharide/colanic/teichoic acid biosynthesis glycosyltransferase